MSKAPLLLLIFFLCFSVLLNAGTTGKIVGTVSDAETGDALPGLNVILQKTNLGAATSLEGTYLILNIQPGTYDLKFSMIGYTDRIIRDVRVAIDLTTAIDVQMTSEVLTGKQVTVVAERPIVTRDISNSQVNIDAKAVENIPVPSVKEVLSLQAGIEHGREGILVRGGSAGQTTFMVDGLSLNDERSNIPYTAMSLSSLQEIKVQTGGFNAEYGNMRSGLVNVVTKEGRKDTYSGIAIVQYKPAAQKNFGRSVYDPSSYFNRPYLDPAVCWTGTDNGAWDSHMQRQYPFFEGWGAVSHATLQDSDPDNDLSPDGAKRLYEWQHRRQGDIKKPDYVIDAGFGGPLPFIGEKLGNLRFHLSHFRQQDMFVYPLSEDSYDDFHTQLKMTSDINASMKLTFIGLLGKITSVSPYSWTTTPTGRVVRDQQELVSLLNSTSGNSVLYMPGYYSPSEIDRRMAGLKFSHVLSPETFYEVSLQHKANEYNTYQMASRDTSSVYEPVPGYFVDEAPYGYWGYGSVGVDGMSMGGWMNLGRDTTVIRTTTLRADITSQINLSNQIKTGIELVYNNIDVNSRTISPSMATWTRSMIYDVSPYRIGGYVQDKLEFKGFVANVGVRMDYYNPNSDRFQLYDDENYFDPYFGAGYGNAIEEDINTNKTDAIFEISPRLGVSHPITENSKLYFNYGHFMAEPQSSTRFRLQRESNGLVTYMGDPSLEPEKTVSYELGFTQNVLNMFLLNLAAYYKDVTNQTGWVQYKGVRDVNYYRAVNNNYADIRGFEITLTKHMGRWFTGFVNYTYDVRTSGYFGLEKVFEDPKEQRDYLRLNPYQEKPQPRPFARANIDLHTPDDFGPLWMGIHPFSAIYWNILADWKAGRYETFNPNSIPGVVDDVQWRDWHNVDMRFSKVLGVKKYKFQFYLNFTNIFNVKYMTSGLFNYRNYAGFANSYDYNDYLESLNFSWEKGDQKGSDKVGEYRPVGVAYDPLELNPNNDPEIKARNDKRKEKKSYIDNPNIMSLAFLNPRSVTFGIKINF